LIICWLFSLFAKEIHTLCIAAASSLRLSSSPALESALGLVSIARLAKLLVSFRIKAANACRFSAGGMIDAEILLSSWCCSEIVLILVPNWVKS